MSAIAPLLGHKQTCFEKRILMLAEIAMRQALAHGRPKPAAAPQKKAVGNTTSSGENA